MQLNHRVDEERIKRLVTIEHEWCRRIHLRMILQARSSKGVGDSQHDELLALEDHHYSRITEATSAQLNLPSGVARGVDEPCTLGHGRDQDRSQVHKSSAAYAVSQCEVQ